MQQSLSLAKRLRFFLSNRVARRIALRAGGALLVFVIGARFIWPALPLWEMIGSVVVVFCATYIASYQVLHNRMELARRTLHQIRRHQFENLETTESPKGDELNALIWQVYRTGLALEKEIRELRKIENYRRDFLGNVSHELKTPIFAIHGFAETLLDGAIHDERFSEAFVEKILRNAKRLHNLAQDLAAIARIETGELKMTMEPFHLARLVREIIESLEGTAADKTITLQYHLSEGLPTVMGDRERIGQVITNLVDNAIKYNDEGGHVEVVARRLPTNEVKISIVDNGIGIPPQHIARLTERFFRVDTSRSRSQGGTGLGLAIVKHILGAHKQTLRIESGPNKGSTFSFALAVAETPALPEKTEVVLAPQLDSA